MFHLQRQIYIAQNSYDIHRFYCVNSVNLCLNIAETKTIVSVTGLLYNRTKEN
jgi:hypothetical protein